MEGREITYEGETIDLNGRNTLMEGILEEYRAIVTDEIFFGETIPEVFSTRIDIHVLIDDPGNIVPRYCFIDDPRNGLERFANEYATWLLSNSARAKTYSYVQEGRLIWRPQPAFALLDAFERAREKLFILSTVSAGPSTRTMETPHQLLRNIIGTEIRHVMILKHNLCILSIQDNTDQPLPRSSPSFHRPTHEVTHELIVNLTFFRPFESVLVAFFHGVEKGKRFNTYLWPRCDDEAIVDAVSSAIPIHHNR